jgi:chromosome segregation protein
VTSTCERIDANGILTLGTFQSALGLVSRRSEMHAAKDEIRHYEQLARQALDEIARVQENILQQAQQVRLLDEAARTAANALSRHHFDVQSSTKSLQLFRQQQTLFQSQLDEQSRVQGDAQNAIAQMRDEIQKAGLTRQLTDHKLAKLAELESAASSKRQAWLDQISSGRVALAKSEQQIESDRAFLSQLHRDHDERQQAVADTEALLMALARRMADNQQAWNQAQEDARIAHESLTTIQASLKDSAQEAAAVRGDLHDAQRRTDQLQRQLDKCQDREQLLASDIEGCLDAARVLGQRFKEDYQIDLLDPRLDQRGPMLEDRTAAEAEVANLRQEIAEVGAVNMEALRELDELQARFDTLDGHYQDLLQSKDALLRILSKINQDSKKLFLDTLDAIRVNFQHLYRKSFGGGHADILLEHADDVLECGVDIVATPPGKTSLSNSLLSGGEKALTAVALIMAIFQYRPSPFCVLDEVDAPFDEANIGRFVAVLGEFLDWTKFIVVTHSKKTMTAANTLYGVTMQENGVSTQVSVRFEDVDDQGNILQRAA